MKRATNESPGYLAACKVAEPLEIPRVGARVLPGGKLVRAKVCVDFAGTLRDGSGRCFVCDFKRNDGVNVFPISENFLAPHQRDELIRHGLRNAVAGLLIESTYLRKQFWCSWRLLEHRQPSVPWSRMIDLGPASAVADLSVVTNNGKDER